MDTTQTECKFCNEIKDCIEGICQDCNIKREEIKKEISNDINPYPRASYREISLNNLTDYLLKKELQNKKVEEIPLFKGTMDKLNNLKI